MKFAYLSLAFVLISCVSFAQNDQHIKDQLPQKVTYPDSIADPDLGVDIYEPLNMLLAADSVRLCDGYDCEGWITDYYTNGNIIHKGFYVDGQLKVYKNYYPDGTLERDFSTVDNYRCQVTLYYPNGEKKSFVKYLHGTALVWTDYFEDGKMKYYEEFHKSLSYHIAKKSFYASGQTEDELVLIHKKKLNYDKNTYYNDGTMSVDGEMKFDESTYDYLKIGTWKYYDESGQIKKQLTYNNGRVSDEKKF